jgi:hypothetical protein
MYVHDVSLDSQAYIPSESAPEDAEALRDFVQTLTPKLPSEVRRGIVIGEIERIDEVQGGYAVKLKHMAATLPLTASAHRRMVRSFRREMTADKSQCALGIAIVVVSLNEDGELQVGRIAIAQSSLDYIIVESRYEAQVVNELVAKGRRFLKPIRSVDGLSFRPDILLLDTPTPTTMEIYGVGSKKYLLQMERKEAEYRKLGRPHWSWRPKLDKAMTPFPQQALQYAQHQ